MCCPLFVKYPFCPKQEKMAQGVAGASIIAIKLRLALLLLFGIPMAIISTLAIVGAVLLPNAPVTVGTVGASYVLSTVDTATIRKYVHDPAAGVGEEAVFDHLQNTLSAMSFFGNIMWYIHANMRNIWVVILHAAYHMTNELVTTVGEMLVENKLLQCLLVAVLQLYALLLDTVLRMADRLMRVLALLWRGTSDAFVSEYASPTSEFIKYPIEAILKASQLLRLLVRIVAIIIEEMTPALASLMRWLVPPLLKTCAVLLRLVRRVLELFDIGGIFEIIATDISSVTVAAKEMGASSCELVSLLTNTVCLTTREVILVSNLLYRLTSAAQRVYGVVTTNYLGGVGMDLPGMGDLQPPVSVLDRRPDGFFAAGAPDSAPSPRLDDTFYAVPVIEGIPVTRELSKRLAMAPLDGFDAMERIALGQWPPFIIQLCRLRRALPTDYADVQEEHLQWRAAILDQTTEDALGRSDRLQEAHSVVCSDPYLHDGVVEKELLSAAAGLGDWRRWVPDNRMTGFWDFFEDLNPFEQLMNAIYDGFPGYLRDFGDRMLAGAYATAQFVASGITMFLGDYWNVVELVKRLVRDEAIGPFVSQLEDYITRLYGPLQGDITWVQSIWAYLEEVPWRGTTYAGRLVDYVFYEGIHAKIQEQLVAAASEPELIAFPTGMETTDSASCTNLFDTVVACGHASDGVLNPTANGAMAMLKSRITFYQAALATLAGASGTLDNTREALLDAMDVTDVATMATLASELLTNGNFVNALTELAVSASRMATEIATEIDTYAGDGQLAPGNYSIADELCPVTCMFTPRDPDCYTIPACGVQGYWPNGTLPETNVTRFMTAAERTDYLRTSVGYERSVRASAESRAERAILGKQMRASALHINLGAIGRLTQRFMDSMGDTTGYNIKDTHDAVFWPQPIPDWYHALDVNDPDAGRSRNNGSVLCADPLHPFASCTTIFDTYSCCRCLLMCQPITVKPGDRIERTPDLEYLANLQCAEFTGYGAHTLRLVRRITDSPVRQLLSDVEHSTVGYAIAASAVDWMLEPDASVRNMTTRDFYSCVGWHSWYTVGPCIGVIILGIVIVVWYPLIDDTWKVANNLQIARGVRKLNKMHTWATLVDR